MRIWVAFFLCIAIYPGAARAAWHEASSDHFVVYANDSPVDLRRFSLQLERYHKALAVLTRNEAHPVPSPSNRVTVFVVSQASDVRELHGGGNRWVRGFYLPRAGGPIVVVPTVQVQTGTRPTVSMTTLLHEYAHHFMVTHSNFPMLRWYSEGGAEFFASARFGSDGGVIVGGAAQHRGPELYYARDVHVEQLLDQETYRQGRNYDAFYGKSWLLFHYLTMTGARSGQLRRYLLLLEQGKGARAAASEAFGDFAVLEKELEQYLRKNRFVGFDLAPEVFAESGRSIAVRPLSPGEAEMMPVRIRSRTGVDEKEAAEVVADARAIAARHPDDAAVLAALAEAEHDAGNLKEAIAAADRAIAIDPGQVNAYVQKGYAQFRLAPDAADRTAAFKAARGTFVRLNMREVDHPLPLIYNYRFYTEQGLEPTELAIRGLSRASELAPFDLGLRMHLGRQLYRSGDYRGAWRALLPVAYNPHGAQDGPAGAALELVRKIETEHLKPEDPGAAPGSKSR